jgi:hypothetical protein
MEQYLHTYVSYQQDDWSRFLPLAEFATNNHVSESTHLSPFEANYGRHLRMTFSPLTHGKTTAEDRANGLARYMSQTFEFLRDEMKRSQIIQEEFANANRVPALRYSVGDKVWLATRNLETKHPSKNLNWKQIGPYTVMRIVSPYPYELDLPASMKVHPVFHVSLLSLAARNPVPGQNQPPPPTVEVDGDEEWEVDVILDSRNCNGRLWYLTRYVGYAEPFWQYAEDLEQAPNTVRSFHHRYLRKPQPRRSYNLEGDLICNGIVQVRKKFVKEID